MGLGAKSSFSSAKPAFSRGYVCVIKSPEHCLFIAEIKTKLFLSFMALCVCVYVYIKNEDSASKQNTATGKI